MKVHHSALKHGVSAEDALHAARHRIYESLPDDSMPAKQFVMGFDTTVVDFWNSSFSPSTAATSCSSMR